jgi:putative toxin-antitoxin system antitoxin component (TIGR02293 family)
MARIVRHMHTLRDALNPGNLPSPETIQKGLSFESFTKLQSQLGVPDQRLAQHLSLPLRTLQRRMASGRFTAEESDRIVRLTRIFCEAMEILGNVEAAREWMTTPNPSIGNRTPLELTSTDSGCVEVERLLGKIAYGVF